MEQAWYRLGIAYLNWNKSATRKVLDSRPPSPYGKLLLAELQVPTLPEEQVEGAEEDYSPATEHEPHYGLRTQQRYTALWLPREESPGRRDCRKLAP